MRFGSHQKTHMNSMDIAYDIGFTAIYWFYYSKLSVITGNSWILRVRII